LNATSQILSIMSMEEVVRCAVVKALGMIASRGHCFVMDAAASILHGTDLMVAAMFAFKFFAETGDKSRISSTIERFRGRNCEIHLIALEVLGELAESGSTEAVVAVTTCLLGQMHNDALCIALEQLVALANKGDSGALFSDCMPEGQCRTEGCGHACISFSCGKRQASCGGCDDRMHGDCRLG